VSPEKPRYRFAGFTLCPARRLLLRDGEEVPLIARYFDLLVLLVERRGEALSRREILDAVWSDVVVTDNALNQAVRTLRRTLGDDSRRPEFLHTVARHGYRFDHPEVVEEPDEAPLPVRPERSGAPVPDEDEDPFREPLAVLLERDGGDEDALYRAAETLHRLGTVETLRRLDRRFGHPRARAILRDARWNFPGAGKVPILGQPGPFATTMALAGMRARRALRLAGKRWLSAAGGGAAAGVVAGLVGALVLRFGPGSAASNAVFVALPLVGFLAGGLGASGVGAGLSAAEAVIRSFRSLALVLCGAAGGGFVGAVAHALAGWTLQGLFGREPSPLGGGFEGLIIGAAAGLGYALSTPTREGGMATPHGRARVRAALLTGLVCAAAAAVLGWTGSHLGAMSLDFMARSFPGSQVGLEPLSRLLGETAPGAITRVVISAYEGLFFGAGLALGLTRRP
jgi:DNA-binding winged helix-turn-helix (wHTH) protein